MDVGCTIYDVRLLGMTQDWRTQDSGFFHQISFINLPESTIQLSIKNLSSIKYNVFLRLINTMDIEIIEENINDYDGLINGTISLNYKNE